MDFLLDTNPETGKKFVVVVVGGGGWLKVILVFSFGPNLWSLEFKFWTWTKPNNINRWTSIASY